MKGKRRKRDRTTTSFRMGRKLEIEGKVLNHANRPLGMPPLTKKQAYALQCLYIRRRTDTGTYPMKASNEHFNRWLEWYSGWLDVCTAQMEKQ